MAKLAYSYDLGVWGIFEGTLAAKLHPNMMLWNVTRFHPFYALVEARPRPRLQSTPLPLSLPLSPSTSPSIFCLFFLPLTSPKLA